MVEAWMVVREEKHVDPKFWVCLDKADALQIAADVVAYWRGQYDPEDFSDELYEGQVFNFDADDCFRVYVEPVKLRASGETEQEVHCG